MRPKHLLAAAAALSVAATAALAQAADPYVWLEEIEGAKPLATVKQWNAATEAALEKIPGFEARRGRAL
jgi:prolyl oligopeptidase